VCGGGDDEALAGGTREEPVPLGRRTPTSGLIGGFAVDGEIETHLLGLGLDPDPEQEVDDLDDDDRADGREEDGGRDRRPPG
jgi:hypothetical protein